MNETVFHRDAGIGDSFECPLPDGYGLKFVDTIEIESITNSHGISAIENVRMAQLSGPFILAAADSKGFEHFAEENIQVDSYLVDTRNDHQAVFRGEAPFNEAARRLNIGIKLRKIGDLYSRYRFTWFDTLAEILMFAPPVLGAGWLALWTLRVRRLHT